MDNNTLDNTEQNAQKSWEKPAVKAEYSISDITKMGGGGVADGALTYS
jgi:hypothetical protein